jgi:DNA-binding LacI/PurR family transcriptional regulator
MPAAPGPNSSGQTRRPSLSDVAALAGVSRSTASLVIRNAPGPGFASREAVTRAAAELNYRPDRSARALAAGRSRLLGVVFTTRDSFHADLIDAIYPAAEFAGYEVVLSAVVPGRDSGRAVESLVDSRCDGIIELGIEGPSRVVDPELAEPLPIVAVGWHAKGDVDSVRTADDVAMALAVDHLVGLGHRSIAHVDGARRPGSAARRRGYRSAMRRHGLVEEIRILPGDYTEISGLRAGNDLLAAEAPRPTAVIAANDRSAVGLLDALRRAGVLVPEDVSVVGYDDSHLARMSHIELTTVRQDATRMAELAVDAAVGRLEKGRTDAVDLILDPLLVVRSTSGVAPAPATGWRDH